MLVLVHLAGARGVSDEGSSRSRCECKEEDDTAQHAVGLCRGSFVSYVEASPVGGANGSISELRLRQTPKQRFFADGTDAPHSMPP